MKIEGSGSISQRHGSADPDPDPHQNVMDPLNTAPRKRFRVMPDVYLVQKGKFYAEASGEELARDPAQLEEDLCDDTHRILQCRLR